MSSSFINLVSNGLDTSERKVLHSVYCCCQLQPTPLLVDPLIGGILSANLQKESAFRTLNFVFAILHRKYRYSPIQCKYEVKYTDSLCTNVLQFQQFHVLIGVFDRQIQWKQCGDLETK